MKKINLIVFLISTFFICAGCGAPQKAAETDFKLLLSNGDCSKATAELSSKSFLNDEEKAIVAICSILQDDTETAAGETGGSQKNAVKIIVDNKNPVSNAAAAKYLIEYSKIIPPQSFNVNIKILLTALGAAGYGPYKTSVAIEEGSNISKDLATDVIEQLSLFLNNLDSQYVNTNGIIEVWNGTYSLLGGSVQTDSVKEAWRLFTSLANIAIVMFNPKTMEEFETILIKTAIEAVEKNPQISVAVKCDLSSPYQNFKGIVSKKQELLGSLERAVSSATGCTPGRYAP
ncbi:MAG: hypothetical protein JXR91_13160 [Deltaproteobacteria bacterium]|nr:hypothetical protein [Deltaproteobacteria bacterium]